jgi:hypothetical protein
MSEESKQEGKITLDRLLELSLAVELVSANDTLDGKTSYWLGRLGDFCNPAIKTLNKNKDRIGKDITEKQEPLLNELNKLDKERDRIKIADLTTDIQKLNDKYTEEVKALGEQLEDIKIPEFKLSQFIATEDTSRIDKVEEVNEKGDKITKKIEVRIKKGQSLVPVKFYRLMGEYIKE